MLLLESEKLFGASAHCYYWMKRYAYTKDEFAKKMMDLCVNNYKNRFQLPSGRLGNILALSLELHNYVIAEYLLKRENVDTNVVAHDSDSKEWSAKQEFENSLLTRDKMRPKVRDESDEDYERYVNYFEENENSCKNVAEMLGLKREEYERFTDNAVKGDDDKTRIFNDSLCLYHLMQNYAYAEDELAREVLDIHVKRKSILLLPSGRLGNILALALESHNYGAADYLLKKTDVDTNVIIHDLDDKSWNATKAYIYSLLTRDEMRPKREDESDEKYARYVNSFKKNEISCKSVAETLGLTRDESEVKDILCKSAKAILDFIDEDKLDDDVKKAVAFCKSKKHPSN